MGDEGGVRGERGGFPEGGECGEGRRTAVKDLMPHQPNTVRHDNIIVCNFVLLYSVQVVTGIVITKQSVHSFPDKKSIYCVNNVCIKYPRSKHSQVLSTCCPQILVWTGSSLPSPCETLPRTMSM